MEEFIKTFQTHTRMEMLLYGNVDDKVSWLHITLYQNIVIKLIRTFKIVF